MFLKSAVLVLCIAAAGTPLIARADAVPDAAQKAITAAYALQCTAALDPSDANLAAAFAMLSPDFANIDLKGKSTARDVFIAQAKQQMKQFHITTCDNTVVSSNATDANTVVVVISGKYAGQIQAPDGNHDADIKTKAQDTWKLVNGTWMQTESKEIAALVKIDGKVVQDEGN